MRILQVISTIATGGAERVVAHLTRHLARAGHAVAVVSMHDPEGLSVERELLDAGAAVYLLGQRPGLDPRMIPRCARAVRGFRPDLVHTHLSVLKYLLPGWALSARPPIVHTLHNLAERETGRAERALQGLAFRAGVVPVAIGDAVAESVRRVYGREPGATIPNGIPVADYAPAPGARERARAALALPPGAPAFVSVGRLMAQKDHALLLRAFASERLRAAGARLLLAGDGELRADLERQAADLGLGDRVRFLGRRGDVAEVLAAADVFALASRWEGNPLTVMEAMAAGRPVVATAVGCLPELVPPAAGRLVPAGDAAALEAALWELASDPALAAARGAAAARTARERFDAAAMARAYERLYLSLTKGRASGRARAPAAPDAAVAVGHVRAPP